MKKKKGLNFIYLAGMIPVVFLVAVLILLTFDNLMSNRAIYGDEVGNRNEVDGISAIFVNVGILGLVLWLCFYLAYLVSRNPVLIKFHKVIGVASTLCIAAGLAYGL